MWWWDTQHTLVTLVLLLNILAVAVVVVAAVWLTKLPMLAVLACPSSKRNLLPPDHAPWRKHNPQQSLVC